MSTTFNTKSEALKNLALNPVQIMPAMLGDIDYQKGSMVIAGKRFRISTPALVSTTQANKKLLENMSDAEKAMLVTAVLSKQQQRSFNIVTQKDEVHSVHPTNKKIIDHFDILSSTSIPDNSTVKFSGGVMTVDVFLGENAMAAVDDPVKVGVRIVNNLQSKVPHVDFNTRLFRLVCSNGATVEEAGFYGRLDADSLEKSFHHQLSLRLEFSRRLISVLPKLNEKLLGDDFSKFHKRHTELLGSRKFEAYSDKSTYWQAINSVTESAKSSEKQKALEAFAGKVIAGFII